MNITVITAGWRPDGVKKTIETLNNQTYQKFEHIIINDNNPELRKILREVCDGDPRRHWIDFGVRTHFYGAFARNCGAMIAFSYFSERAKKADDDFWIAFLDDDNEWHPDFMERMVSLRNQHPEAVMLGADTEIRGKKDPNFSYVLDTQIAPNNIDLGSVFYRQDILNKYGYFRAGLDSKIQYDYALIKRIADGEGMNKIIIDHSKPGLIFYHKKH